MASLCSLSPSEFGRLFARANVLDRWPGRQGSKGAAFPAAEARERATQLRRKFVRGRVVVLLGKRTAAAFGLKQTGYFWPPQIVDRAWVYVVPHPSGMNRWFNDPANEAEMRLFMRDLVAAAKGRQ